MSGIIENRNKKQKTKNMLLTEVRDTLLYEGKTRSDNKITKQSISLLGESNDTLGCVFELSTLQLPEPGLYGLIQCPTTQGGTRNPLDTCCCCHHHRR